MLNQKDIVTFRNTNHRNYLNALNKYKILLEFTSNLKLQYDFEI